jgi:chemotaxis protein CheC
VAHRIVLSDQQRAGLHAAVAEGLEGMVGRPIVARAREVALVPLGEITGLVGEPTMPVIGVYFSLHDEMSGHLMMILSDADATRLADLLLGQPAGTTAVVGAMEASALQEMANVTGSHLLSGLADAARLTIQPSPPAIARDMCGALLDGPLALLAMQGDEVLFIETEFHQAERRVRAVLLVLPDQPSLEKILGRLA